MLSWPLLPKKHYNGLINGMPTAALFRYYTAFWFLVLHAYMNNFCAKSLVRKRKKIDKRQTNKDVTMIFGSYIAVACSGDMSSVRYFLIILKYDCDT